MTHQTARGRLIVVIGGLVFGPLALWACYGGSLGSLGYACAFSEGTSQACYVLERLGLTSATESYMGRDSWMRVAEHTMRISVERRLRTEEMECAAGELWGCYQLALDLSVSEDQTSTDLARAVQLFERVCHHAGPTDSPWGAPYGTFVAQGACVALGDAYRHGDGVEQNVAQARQVYTDVCDASDQGIGCSELAHMMFAAGEDRGEVRRLVTLACEGVGVGWQRACLLLACLNMSDPDETLFERACDTRGHPPFECIVQPGLALAERCSRYRSSVYRDWAP